MSGALAQSSVDVQALQTRVYEASEKDVIRSIVSVFQNNKYDHISSDVNVGLIQAILPTSFLNETEEKAGQRMAANFALGMLGVPIVVGDYESGVITRSVQASVEESMPNKTTVRLILKENKRITKTGAYGGTSQSSEQSVLLNRPDLYRAIFSEIDKEVFLRKSKSSAKKSLITNADKNPEGNIKNKSKIVIIRDKLVVLNKLLELNMIDSKEYAAKKQKLIDDF